MFNTQPAILGWHITLAETTSPLNFFETTPLRFPAISAAARPPDGGPAAKLILAMLKYVVAGFLAAIILYLSLITTASPVPIEEINAVKRAITVLQKKGFTPEPFLLRNLVVYPS